MYLPCLGYLTLKAKLTNCKDPFIHYPEKYKLKWSETLTVQLEFLHKKAEAEIQSSTNVWSSNKKQTACMA